MKIHEFDKIKLRDGRVGLVYAVSEKSERLMVVFDERKDNDYPLVADGLFDGAVDVPIKDVACVVPA